MEENNLQVKPDQKTNFKKGLILGWVVLSVIFMLFALLFLNGCFSLEEPFANEVDSTKYLQWNCY